jgi:hypothetical protein
MKGRAKHRPTQRRPELLASGAQCVRIAQTVWPSFGICSAPNRHILRFASHEPILIAKSVTVGWNLTE